MRLRCVIAGTVLAVGTSMVAPASPATSASLAGGEASGLAPYQRLSQASPAYFPPPDAGCDPALVAMGGRCETSEALAAPPEAAAEEVRLQRTTVPSVQWPVSVVPLPERRHRPAGGYLLVHQAGDVSLMAADGSRTWHRPGATLHSDWGIAPVSVLPQLRSGYDAFDPFNQVSERMFAFGTVTRSGTEHLAVAHRVRWHKPNVGGQVSYFVTVFDVATGEAAWVGFYPGAVTQLLIHDGVLVVGHETGDPSAAPGNGPEGEAGTQTVLTGLEFSGRKALTAKQVWSYSTGVQWARWLAVEPTGPGAIATAWTATRPGADGDGYGRVLRLDVATGARTWGVTTDSYPRLLRYDADRDRIVVVGQVDPTSAWSYTLRALRAADGTAAGPGVTRSAAIPFALEVADVDGEAGAEWVTSDVTMTSEDPATGAMAGGTVVAARGDDGGTVWRADASQPAQQTGPTGAPIAPHPYGLAILDGVVLVATYFPGTEPTPLFIRRYTGESELRALAGSDGTVRWHRRGDVLTPLALVPYSVGGESAVLTGTGRLVLNAYSLADGSVLRRTPLLAEIMAAETVDVNRDGVTDLVVGGQSEAVLALDGRTLGVNPTVLWATPVAGEVHEIHAVTLPGGERRLVVVAATAAVVDGNQIFPVPVKSGVDVLAADTGARKYRIPVLPDYAWTAVIAELTPGGVPVILVPSRTLTAYRVTDGARLWRFDPAAGVEVTDPVMNPVYFSNPVVTSDGKVAVEYFVKAAVDAASARIQPTDPDNHTAAVLDGATGKPVWQVRVASPGTPQLWRGVAGEVETAVGTPGVAFMHQVHQLGVPTRTQVDVYDLATGVLSYSAVLDRYYRGIAALPINGLVSWGGIFELVSISPEGHVSRRVFPHPHDLAEAHSARFGDVLVTATSIGWLGVFAPVPTADGFTRLAMSAPFAPRGGSLRVRDTEGDGSDEILHYSYDLPALNATQNMYGRFAFQIGLPAPKALAIYSLD